MGEARKWEAHGPGEAGDGWIPRINIGRGMGPKKSGVSGRVWIQVRSDTGVKP